MGKNEYQDIQMDFFQYVSQYLLSLEHHMLDNPVDIRH